MRNEYLEEEKSLRIGIGFHKGSARVEGNLLLGCFHRKRRKNAPNKPLSIEEEEAGEPPPSLSYEEEESATAENQAVPEE